MSCSKCTIGRRQVATIVVALTVGLVGGLFLGGGPAPKGKAPETTATAEKPTTWTCSMHPQIKQPNPGDCPICGMDLIPLSQGGEDSGPRELKMSETARKLAEIQTTPVRRQVVGRTVNLVGNVTYDETRVKTITAWVGGRLDRLYVDYTGIPVREGDHMVYLYSPEILAAQEELLQARKAVTKLSPGTVRQSAEATLAAVRDRLRLWGLTDAQIAAVETSGKADDHVTINAPAGGIVVHKNAVEGMYVKTGTPIYSIADLSRLWVVVEAYESDLAWLRYGQQVELQVEAYPGETFEGRLSFIDPVLTTKTRTVQVRVNVENRDGRLKPGMFARAKVKAPVAANGKVLDPSLDGKWISPMHPEVVKDGPGSCDVCGMDLAPAESLGFASKSEGLAESLVIPVSAALVTGERAVVYVQDTSDPSRFTGRTVTLGTRAEDLYLVREGLEEGELVVTNGAFKIDSALQIVAKPSMMNPESGVPGGGAHQHGHDGKPMTLADSAHAPLANAIRQYLAVQEALADDDAQLAGKQATALAEAIDAVPMAAFEGEAHNLWMKRQAEIRKAAKKVAGGTDLDEKRKAFEPLSAVMVGLTKTFGNVTAENLKVVRCSMAFDNVGASWLQRTGQTANPYFGSTMLRCGDDQAELPSHVAVKPSELAEPVRAALTQVIEAYLAVQEALSSDKTVDAGKAAASFVETLDSFPMGKLDGKTHDEWMPLQMKLAKSVGRLAKATEIEEQRNQFDRLSATMIKVAKQFGTNGMNLRLAHCPMAFDDIGADWLQRGDTLANPYFGSRMLRCGKVKETLK